MASDETMTVNSSSVQDDDYDYTDDGFEHDHDLDHQPHTQNLSRLSVCTSSIYTNDDEEDEDRMRLYMSRLSLESFDADADEEFSDEKELEEFLPELSSDSDKEPSCYSLPVTPPRRRSRNRALAGTVKEYASENEAQKESLTRQKAGRNLRKRKIVGERWEDKNSVWKAGSEKKDQFSGESEGVVVITRPKGGRRSLCMDLDEVKACRDLGFELEHERMLEMPSRVSLSASTLDTSSGGNSPIGNWRISSPGDDPRDVKARLKVWAQAVALASASRHSS